MKPIYIILLLLALSGCVVIPYPHDGYSVSNVSGQIRDRDSGKPIPGMELRIGDNITKSDDSGNFRFVPSKERHFYKTFPLLPFDFIYPCRDTLEISDKRRTFYPAEFRNVVIEVTSCPYSSVHGFHLDNPSKYDDLGVIYLLKNAVMSDVKNEP